MVSTIANVSTIPVCMRGLEGTCRVFYLPLDSTIEKIKDIMNELEGVPSDLQRLVFGSKTLEGNKSLRDYGISPYDTLSLCLKLQGGMRVFLETQSKGRLTFQLEPTDTVEKFMTLVEDRVGIPADRTRLMFDGESLNNDKHKTIGDWGVQEDDIVDLFSSQIGGGCAPLSTLPDLQSVKTLDLTSSGPKWLAVTEGLNLQATCLTSECEAYNQLVWIKLGFGKFDMHKAAHTATCPACEKETEVALNLGFRLCKYSYEGAYKDEKGTKVTIKSAAKTDRDNQLYTFEKEGHKRDWLYLNLDVSPLPGAGLFSSCSVM